MPNSERVRSIVIVGGGAAGWLIAATLVRALRPDFCSVRLLETERGARVTSLATLPTLHRLNRLLGLDERDLMRKTCATFSLGTRFSDWGRLDSRYFHTFGSIGARLAAVPFHQHWLRLRSTGALGPIEEFSMASTAATQGRFVKPSADSQSVLSHFSYGYHFDAELLTQYLREYALARGAECIAGKAAAATLDSADGCIESLRLEDGSVVSADLFVDCMSDPANLLSRAVESSFIDWSSWLPCDRAVTVAATCMDAIPPFSHATARDGGWQWEVPLRDRVDVGYAYSSRFLDDSDAVSALLVSLPGSALEEPRPRRFRNGRPREFWRKNCIAIRGDGIEPLEATGLHLVQTAAARLLTLFPLGRTSPADAEEYNRLTSTEYDSIRDFLIAHYKLTSRDDSPFWKYCRDMDVPGSVQERLALFANSGRIRRLDDEHFGDDSWLMLLLGQGAEPMQHDPLADGLEVEIVRNAFARARSMIRTAVSELPSHREFVERYT